MSRSGCVAALALACVAAEPAAAQAPSDAGDPSFRLYLAATAAAEASLRLHETAAARRWLDEAPAAHRGWEWRYLSAQADRSSARLDAHTRVLDVAVSPDGRRLATSGADGSVKLWDAASLALERTLAGHTAAVWTVAFSPDGHQLATASTDRTARVWDVATGSEVRKLEGVSRGIATVAWSPDGARLATTGWDRSEERGVWGVVKVWSSDGALVRSLEHGVKPIVTSSWSPDGTRFFAGTWDDDVAVWDTATWAPEARAPSPEGRVLQGRPGHRRETGRAAPRRGSEGRDAAGVGCRRLAPAPDTRRPGRGPGAVGQRRRLAARRPPRRRRQRPHRPALGRGGRPAAGRPARPHGLRHQHRGLSRRPSAVHRRRRRDRPRVGPRSPGPAPLGLAARGQRLRPRLLA